MNANQRYEARAGFTVWHSPPLIRGTLRGNTSAPKTYQTHLKKKKTMIKYEVYTITLIALIMLLFSLENVYSHHCNTKEECERDILPGFECVVDPDNTHPDGNIFPSGEERPPDLKGCWKQTDSNSSQPGPTRSDPSPDNNLKTDPPGDNNSATALRSVYI